MRWVLCQPMKFRLEWLELQKLLLRKCNRRIFSRNCGRVKWIAKRRKYILAKVSGATIDQTGGVLQGMSGSPVYINGKLIRRFLAVGKILIINSVLLRRLRKCLNFCGICRIEKILGKVIYLNLIRMLIK